MRSSAKLLLPLVAVCALSLGVLGGILPKTLKVGGLFPCIGKTDGQFDPQGMGLKAAAQLAVKHMNQRTKLVPEDEDVLPPGVTLELHSRDDKKDQGVSIFQALNLVQDTGVIALLGSAASSLSIQVQLVARQYGVAQISAQSTMTSLNDMNDYPTFLRVVPPDDFQTQALAWLCKNYFSWDRVGLIYDNGGYSSSGASDFFNAATKIGLNIVSAKMFQNNWDYTQVKPLLQQMVDANVKVFVMWTGNSTKVIRAAKELGIVGLNSGYQWITGDETTSVTHRTGPNEDLEPYYDGMIATLPTFSTDTERHRALSKLWQARKAGEDYPAGTWVVGDWTDSAPVGAKFEADPDSKTLYNTASAASDKSDDRFTYDSSQDKVMDEFSTLSYESAIAVGQAIKQVYKNNATYIQTLTDDKGEFLNAASRKAFADLLTATLFSGFTYTGATGPVTFEADGDRILEYALYYFDSKNPGSPAPVLWGHWSVTDKVHVHPDIKQPVMFSNGKYGVENTPLDNAHCVPGQYENHGGCLPCKADTYSTTNNALDCLPCAAGTGTLGKTGQSACVACPDDMFALKDGDGCRMCPTMDVLKDIKIKKDKSDPSTTGIIFVCSAIGVIAFMGFIYFTSQRFLATRRR